jgi:NitT/TauT family transport system ATP-binding protein
MSKPLLFISNLDLVINKNTLFCQISISLNCNERIGITGPSGCGKSTLLKSIINRKFPYGSKQDGFQYDASATCAYIPQSNGLLPWFSLKKNLSVFSKNSELTEQVIKRCRLENVLSSFPSQLSGGEYQRATLACGLISSPSLYIADEPLTELDLTNKWKMLSFWSDQIKETKASLLLVSHDPDTLLYLCDKVIVVSDKPSSVIAELNFSSQHPRDINFLTSPEFNMGKVNLLNRISSREN